DETLAALKRLYEEAPAYGDPAGLIAQLARKRVAKQNAEPEQKRQEYDRIVRERKRHADQRISIAEDRRRRRPIIGRIMNLAIPVRNSLTPEKPLPAVPELVTQEMAETEVKEEVWPPLKWQFQTSEIPW